jgi:hypothetical protein
MAWREATARRASGSLEFNCKIRDADLEQEPGRGIKGSEFACPTPGGFQRITVRYDHVAVRHNGIADLNMLESAGIQQKFKFSFSHFFLIFYYRPQNQHFFCGKALLEYTSTQNKACWYG